MLRIGKALSQEVKSHGESQVLENFDELLHLHSEGQSGGINPADISIRDLFENLVADGREAIRLLDPRTEFDAMEFSAVNTSLFSRISGQIIYSRILQAYRRPEFVLTGLIPSESTSFQDGEKIPGMTRLEGDDVGEVGEGEAYQRAGFTDEYVETPRTTKRGLIVSVTREAVFGDRIGLVLRRASEVGEVLGLAKERRLIDLLIGATNNYSRNGVSLDTYQTSSPWINDQSNPLLTWSDVDESDQLFNNMVDPNSGEEILISGSQYLFSHAKRSTVQRIFGASEIRETSGSVVTVSPNPISGAENVSFSRLLKNRIVTAHSVTATQANDWWFHGEFSRAFSYRENWPLTTVQAPRNSTAEFERDIVAEYKASEKGVGAVIDPRYIVRNKN